MATVYWYGGTGNWSDYANHWSNNSGNSPASNHGAAPGSDDDVVFDANSASGNYSVTTNVGGTCKNMTWGNPTGGVPTFIGTQVLTISGSLYLVSGMGFSGATVITFNGTAGTETINTNGVTITTGVVIDATGGKYTLAGNLTYSGSYWLVQRGEFDTANYSITGTDFQCKYTNTKTLTLGSSTLNLSGNFDILSTNTTMTANTATINMTGSSKSFIGAGYTWNIVTITGSLPTITGNNTFGTLSVTGTAITTEKLTLSGNQTITGALTLSGNSAINRLLVRSSTYGTARTITTTGGSVSVTSCDFQDITATGDAGEWDLSAAATGSGDCGGNTGITFTTADDWYWHVDAGNVSNYAKWYTATNGGGSQMASTRIPLPQDTLHFDASSFDSASQTVTQDIPRIGGVVFTGATNSPTFKTNITNDTYVFGSFILISAMTYTKNLFTHFQGRGTFSIDTGTKTFGYVTIECPTGTYSLASNIVSDGTFTLSFGTFDCNDFNSTFTDLAASATSTRGLIMGSGTFTVNGNSTNPIDLSGAGLTLTPETSTFKISISSVTGSKRIRLSTYLLNNLWIDSVGTGNVYFNETTTLNDFKITAGCKVNFTDGIDVNVTSLDWVGTSTNKITLRGTSTAGWRISDTTGTNNCDWLDIDYSTAEGGATFNATNSTDGGHNSGWNITGPASNTGNFFNFI